MPIVTPEEMAAIDADAPEPVDVLIGRAGAAVAAAARRMLGGTYGRSVVIVAGKGNNGADGRAAGELLEAAGVRVVTFPAADAPAVLPPADLVIDAAYGTGFRGAWKAPDVGETPVLAVDLPSGVDGLTGEARGPVLAAERTATFAALKPGLLFGAGRGLGGSVEVADIGLDCSRARAHLIDEADVAGWWCPRPPDANKWSRAVRIIAGSPGMTGAAYLCSGAAQRAGAGMVTLSSPGVDSMAPVEVVHRQLPDEDWSKMVLDDLERFQALIIGPGLGRDEATQAEARVIVAQAPVPVLVDGDGLFAIGRERRAADLLERRTAPTVLTPHDGEFRYLTGEPPGADRIDTVRRLATSTGAVVLLKGPATVAADPTGDVLVSASGDDRLATAGTGDVLSGVIGALLAADVSAVHAAAAGAWIHGAAAALGPPVGLIASDLLELLPDVVVRLT